MGISEKFKDFNKNIRISDNNKTKISNRYKRITKQLNIDFWWSISETSHSLYVWSYWRDTDIHVSDVDVIFQIPYHTYKKYDNYQWNWQSALLQAIKESIQKTYKTTDSHWDGQVVAVDFTDWIKFEIVPWVLLKDDKWFWYPDTNNWWMWKTTNPKSEIREIREKNEDWNYNLKRLCRMLRSWKDNCNVPIWGLLIDTLCYNFLKNWEHSDKSFIYYDYMTRDLLEYLKDQNTNQDFWYALGSNQKIYKRWNFIYKALLSYNISLVAIDYEEREMNHSANKKWKEIFWTQFTW